MVILIILFRMLFARYENAGRLQLAQSKSFILSCGTHLLPISASRKSLHPRPNPKPNAITAGISFSCVKPSESNRE